MQTSSAQSNQDLAVAGTDRLAEAVERPDPGRSVEKRGEGPGGESTAPKSGHRPRRRRARLDARRFGRATLAAARRIREIFPITLLGLAVGGAAAAIFFVYGLGESDYVLYAAGALAMALVAIALLGTLSAALYLRLKVRGADAGLEEEMVTGSPAETAFRLPRLRFWPLVQVSADWQRPAAIELELRAAGPHFKEMVTPRERGRYPTVTRRIAVSDIFGLTSLTFRRTWVQPLRIVPVLGAQTFEISLRHSSADGYSHPSGKPIGEMVEMRRYAHGDPMRYVLWKTYARSRRLMVRSAERAIAPVPSMMAYLVAGRGDEASASTARAFVEGGLLGDDFAFFADGALRPAAHSSVALDQIVDSIHHRDEGGLGLARFVRQVDPAKLDNCVIFAPGRRGPWIERLLATAGRMPRPPQAIVTVEETEPEPTRGRIARLLWRDGSEPHHQAELPLVCDALRTAGLVVHVVHRATGRIVPLDRVEALRRR